ncbi:MAG TPA: MMPL family transporter [Thermoanaerobaculia bacterium]|nr:MMPL family transporter [Thermoanaerobaculia bacterium]
MTRLLDALARLCLRHSKRIAILSVVVALIAAWGASRLSFDPDLLNLIPQKNKQVNDFRKALSDLGTIDYHIIVLDLPEKHDIHEYDSLIDAIAEGYRKNPRIEDVSYKIPNPLDFIGDVLPRALLFLTPEELKQVETKLSDAGIRESVARNRALLQTPQSFALKTLVQYDPFNLLPIYLNKFKLSGGGFKMDASSGYYLSSDHRMLLILTKPRRPAQDVPFGKALLQEGALIEANALKNFQQSSGETPLPVISHTGGYVIANGDADLIRYDVIVNIIGSVIGVLALFLYAFRRTASLGYAGAPLVLGLLLTFGMAGFVYGQLSSASAGFAALLAGLGIDFITVLYGRYVDERNRGEAMQQAIVTTIRSTMPGVFIAAITTAATFYAFLATDFRGMSQLGMLTGTGIVFFLLCVMFLLPALIVLSERRERRKAPKLYLHSFGAGRIIDASIARPKATIVAWLVFIVICGGLATRLRFSDNIQDLRAKGNPGVVTQAKITDKFGQSFDFMMWVIEGKSLDDVLDRTQSATQELSGLVDDRTIASYQSIATFLPPRDQQLATIAALHAGANDRFNPKRIHDTFIASLNENGFKPSAYDDYWPLFEKALQPNEPVTLANLGNPDLLKLSERFVKKTPRGTWMSVIYFYPAGGKWPREVPQKLLDAANRHPNDIVTGVNLVSGTLRRIVRNDAKNATIIGFLAVAVLMFISFRTVKMTLLTFVPFVAGATGMLGLMALFNLEFNFMNIFVGLMIIGVATDYAVYMLQRYVENPATFHKSAHETGKAILMAALTAIVGYGSFAFSHYPGLRSIGYASFFGIGLSGIAAITLLPAILVLGEAKNGNDDSAHRARAADPR